MMHEQTGALSWHARRRAPAKALRMPRVIAAVLYALVIPLASLLAAATVFGVASLTHAMGLRVNWLAIAINIVPPLLVGFLSFAGVARVLAARHALTPGIADHLRRASPMYVIAALFGAWLVIGFRQPGFGLFAQAILWPWLAVLGGIVADLVTARVLGRT